MPLRNWRHYCFVLNKSNSIKLMLRRTLVLQQFYSPFNPPPLENFLQLKYFPRQRGTKTITLFEANRNIFSIRIREKVHYPPLAGAGYTIKEKIKRGWT